MLQEVSNLCCSYLFVVCTLVKGKCSRPLTYIPVDTEIKVKLIPPKYVFALTFVLILIGQNDLSHSCPHRYFTPNFTFAFVIPRVFHSEIILFPFAFFLCQWQDVAAYLFMWYISQLAPCLQQDVLRLSLISQYHYPRKRQRDSFRKVCTRPKSLHQAALPKLLQTTGIQWRCFYAKGSNRPLEGEEFGPQWLVRRGLLRIPLSSSESRSVFSGDVGRLAGLH